TFASVASLTASQNQNHDNSSKPMRESAARLLMLSSIRKFQNHPCIATPTRQSIYILLTFIQETWNTMTEECVPFLVTTVQYFRVLWNDCQDALEKERLRELGFTLLAFDNCIAQRLRRLPLLTDQEIDQYFTTVSVPGTLYRDPLSVYQLPTPITLTQQMRITCASLECVKRSLAIASATLQIATFSQGTDVLMRLWSIIQRRAQWRRDCFKPVGISPQVTFVGPAGDEPTVLTRLNQVMSSEQYFDFFLHLQEFLRRFDVHINESVTATIENDDLRRQNALRDIYRQCEMEVETQWPVLASFIRASDQARPWTAFWGEFLIAMNTTGEQVDPMSRFAKHAPKSDPEEGIQRSIVSLIEICKIIGCHQASSLAAFRNTSSSEFELELERLLSGNVDQSPPSSVSTDLYEEPEGYADFQDLMTTFPSAFGTPPENELPLSSSSSTVSSTLPAVHDSNSSARTSFSMPEGTERP
ncbi:hypothetical protein BT69DRAFT_1282935, partial [Atractiella rhizophila]